MLERLRKGWPDRESRTCYDSAWMFDQNFGSRETRWLKWFMIPTTICALAGLWPENRTVAFIGWAGGMVGIAIARYRLTKGRRGD